MVGTTVGREARCGPVPRLPSATCPGRVLPLVSMFSAALLLRRRDEA